MPTFRDEQLHNRCALFIRVLARTVYGVQHCSSVQTVFQNSRSTSDSRKSGVGMPSCKIRLPCALEANSLFANYHAVDGTPKFTEAEVPQGSNPIKVSKCSAADRKRYSTTNMFLPLSTHTSRSSPYLKIRTVLYVVYIYIYVYIYMHMQCKRG